MPSIALFCYAFLAFIYVCLKPQCDVLQGISKLDHLVKVSVFQKYRQRPAY